MTLGVIWRGNLEGKAAIEAKIKAVLQEHGLTGPVEMGISLVKNLQTDVLSFPLEKEVGPDGVTRLGDILVCPDKAEGQSIEFLILHGLNHLLGIHH